MNYSRTDADLLVVGLVSALVVLVLMFAVYVARQVSKKHRRNTKIFVIIGWHLLLLALLIYTAWPLTAWGREQALQTANQFMSYLNPTDYPLAQDLISGSMEADDYEDIQTSLKNPANYPVSWELAITAPHYVATGRVMLNDNLELPVTLYVDWKWEQAAWKVSEARYNPYGDAAFRNSLRFALYEAGLPYSWFRTIVLVVAVVSMLISLRYLIRLLRTI